MSICLFFLLVGGFKSDLHEGLMRFSFEKVADQGKWKMSFVMPSKYGTDLPLPNDPSVTIKEVPRKIVAVVAFSGSSRRSNYFCIFTRLNLGRQDTLMN